MKIIEKIKIVLNRNLDNTFKVTNLEVLEKQRKDMVLVLNEAKEGLNKARGKNKQKEEEKKEKEQQVKKLIEICKLLDKTKDENKIKEAYALYEEETNKIDNLKKVIEINKKLIKELENKMNIYQTKIKKIEKNMDILKIKAEYADNVEDFKKINQKLKIDGDITDISKKIDEEFFTAEFDLKDIEKETKDTQDFIDNNLEENGYEDFLNMIGEDEK